jgi:hypothetical protein
VQQSLLPTVQKRHGTSGGTTSARA